MSTRCGIQDIEGRYAYDKTEDLERGMDGRIAADSRWLLARKPSYITDMTVHPLQSRRFFAELEHLQEVLKVPVHLNHWLLR
jgi:hypothetical protein